MKSDYVVERRIRYTAALRYSVLVETGEEIEGHRELSTGSTNGARDTAKLERVRIRPRLVSFVTSKEIFRSEADF